MSRPARARGSKRGLGHPPTNEAGRVPRGRADRNGVGHGGEVAAAGRVPRGRADRNGSVAMITDAMVVSRPARARGSKQQAQRLRRRRITSRPARARGSKPPDGTVYQVEACRVPRGRADRNRSKRHDVRRLGGRVPRGRADRNLDVRPGVGNRLGRVPRGRADRNMSTIIYRLFLLLSRPARARGSKLIERRDA